MSIIWSGNGEDCASEWKIVGDLFARAAYIMLEVVVASQDLFVT